jgi:sugar/nucleoside kinase (ribokinase family)
MTTKRFDCVVVGSCVVDLLCRPVNVDQPIGRGVLHRTEPLIITSGGIVCNSGVTLARLGMRTAAFTYVGNDAWAPVLRSILQKDHVDDSMLLTHPTAATSTTVVTIDPTGERSFFHCVGAPKLLDAKIILDHLDFFAASRMMLLGYYSLMPNLEKDLPKVLKELRQAGCQTAMDAAGEGGNLSPLDKMLPHLDVYVPSFDEARHQTGLDAPEKIIDTYRNLGAPGVLGVKLGKKGVLLSGKAGEYVPVPVVPAPGAVVDTTGAGDSFYAGLIAGLLKGLSLEAAGKLGTAAGACCVTSLGGSTGGRDYAATAKLAGIA